ncbi:transposase [Actinomyces provencensis]|uniref:transposase n=1 Tax=Actinomyces provencensis TaxID=1720198 RepID=UPI0018A7EAA4|nr:transposase [Actinomyces provencensis]
MTRDNAYKGRNVVERLFALSKQWKGIETRYEELPITCRSSVTLCAILTWQRP